MHLLASAPDDNLVDVRDEAGIRVAINQAPTDSYYPDHFGKNYFYLDWWSRRQGGQG